MSERPLRASVAVVALVLLAVVAGSVIAGGGAAPVGPAAGQEANETDASAGTVVATGVDTGGESVGTPLEAPGATFDSAFYREVSAVTGAYNEERPDLGLGGGLATDNVVNFHVTADDGEEAVVSFQLTEDNRITDVRAGGREEAKIRMTTDKETFDGIANADSPGRAFGRALESGEIGISGRGLVSGLIWAVVNLLRGLASLA